MKTLFFALVVLLCCSHSNKTSNKTVDNQNFTEIKIAAYNVQYSKNGTAAEIGKALKPYDFDVVCFSEAPGGDWTKIAGKALGMEHYVVGKYSTAGHEDKYKSIVRS